MNFISARPMGDVLADQLAYWKQQLAGISAALELPTDRPRPPVKSYRGASYSFVLSRQLTADLTALSHRERVSLFVILTAAFNTLLHRYTGQDDLLIGVDLPDRRYPEVERSPGIFLNPLPLRTNLSVNPTFLELLASVRTLIIQAEAHQQIPFEYLLKELQLPPEETSGQHPLFQVMLTIQSLEWTLPQSEVNIDVSKFDLSLFFEDQLEGLAGRFEYRTDLFAEATIARMSGHLQTLLRSIVDNPSQRISDLPLLTEAERQQLLVEWNVTQVTYPNELSIPRLFEAQVERTPEAVALVFEGQELTYRELNMRANQLAHHLQTLGVGPEVLVGICMERSVEMIVGLLGVLKAGGAYVPLDPTYPQERLAFMLQDSQVKVLLTQELLQVPIPEYGVHVVFLDTDRAAIAQESEANPANRATAENLAYVIYTSGSTGVPKGVLITHRALVNECLTFKKRFDLQAKDRVLQFASISFDTAAEEIFPTLVSGATLVLRTNEVIDVFSFAHFVEQARLTILNLPTSYWHLWVSELSQRPAPLPTSLRLVVVGGEKASPERFLAWKRWVGNHVHWANTYGPTEATITTTIYEPSGSSEDLEAQILPIGRPIPNTQVYLLDPFLQPVPIGVPGELHIGGAGLARGYLNRPQLTDERFIRHPFSNDTSARLYKTGDLARYLPDGNIEFLGRIDDQVKIRGFRIEPGEIESVLDRHPAVREAVVVAREDTAGDKHLVAYIVLHNEQTTTVADLQDHVLKALPDYMLPSTFVLLDSLPLTPNGKIDRGVLPTLHPGRTLAAATFVAPTLPIHHQLVQLWEELLDVRPIGIQDNFFYLGGHSLLAARVVDRIEQIFGKKLPLATLFAGPTIEHLAHALQSEEEKSSRTPVVAVQASGPQRPFFYLHGAWDSDAFYCFHLAHHLGPDQPFYALAPYNFDGVQDVPTIEEMAAAHISSLRTVQPEGPYLLGGFCNGGLVAYEMASQLLAEGQQVDRLILIEPAYSPLLHTLARGLITCVGNLFGLSQQKRLDYFLRLRHFYKFLRGERRLEDLKGFRSIDPGIQTLFPTTHALRQDDNALFDWIISGYNYDPYPGKIKLMWANEEPFRGIWKRKTTQNKDIELHIIPGTHIGCRTDHIQTLSEELYKCLH